MKILTVLFIMFALVNAESSSTHINEVARLLKQAQDIGVFNIKPATDIQAPVAIRADIVSKLSIIENWQSKEKSSITEETYIGKIGNNFFKLVNEIYPIKAIWTGTVKNSDNPSLNGTVYILNCGRIAVFVFNRLSGTDYVVIDFDMTTEMMIFPE